MMSRAGRGSVLLVRDPGALVRWRIPPRSSPAPWWWTSAPPGTTCTPSHSRSVSTSRRLHRDFFRRTFSLIFFSPIDHEGVQGPVGCRGGHYWTICPASVSQASSEQEEAGGEVSQGAAPIPRGLHLRHGPQEGQEVQSLSGLPARLHVLQEGKDGKVNKRKLNTLLFMLTINIL